MFTHRVQMQLKADSFILLSHKIEKTIMPLIHLQKGFHHGVTFVAPERSTATENTFWNTKQDAEAYNLKGYLEVKKTISEFVTTQPTASIFETDSAQHADNSK